MNNYYIGQSNLTHDVQKDNASLFYVGAIGSPWGPHPERGVYRTSDGGKSWEQILFVNEQTGVADMVIHPREHDQIVNLKIYAFEPPVAYLADTKNAPG